MISRILVAVDGSENADRAFNTSIELAQRLDVPLVVLNVLDDYGNEAPLWKRHDVIVGELEKQHDEMLKRYKAAAEKELHTVVGTIRAEGFAAEQILKTAEDEQAGIIVMGCRGLSPSREFLMGGISQKVVYHSKKPVLLVR